MTYAWTLFLFLCFTLVVDIVPHKWSSLRVGLLLGTPLKSHCIVHDHTYHFSSLKPPIYLSLGVLGCIDPRRGCPSFYGKKEIKAQRDCCWVKDKSLYISLPEALPMDPPRKK
jgi:hypothetical protein